MVKDKVSGEWVSEARVGTGLTRVGPGNGAVCHRWWQPHRCPAAFASAWGRQRERAPQSRASQACLIGGEAGCPSLLPRQAEAKVVLEEQQERGESCAQQAVSGGLCGARRGDKRDAPIWHRPRT